MKRMVWMVLTLVVMGWVAVVPVAAQICSGMVQCAAQDQDGGAVQIQAGRIVRLVLFRERHVMRVVQAVVKYRMGVVEEVGEPVSCRALK